MLDRRHPWELRDLAIASSDPLLDFDDINESGDARLGSGSVRQCPRTGGTCRPARGGRCAVRQFDGGSRLGGRSRCKVVAASCAHCVSFSSPEPCLVVASPDRIAANQTLEGDLRHRPARWLQSLSAVKKSVSSSIQGSPPRTAFPAQSLSLQVHTQVRYNLQNDATYAKLPFTLLFSPLRP